MRYVIEIECEVENDLVDSLDKAEAYADMLVNRISGIKWVTVWWNRIFPIAPEVSVTSRRPRRGRREPER